MDHFELVSEYKPTGDQPQAIEELVEGFKKGKQFQTLLGVTGSGKTFTMANVIEQLNKPTLIIAHNKTLAAQLYQKKFTFVPVKMAGLCCIRPQSSPTSIAVEAAWKSYYWATSIA